jgi:hypothetical protein
MGYRRFSPFCFSGIIAGPAFYYPGLLVCFDFQGRRSLRAKELVQFVRSCLLHSVAPPRCSAALENGPGELVAEAARSVWGMLTRKSHRLRSPG